MSHNILIVEDKDVHMNAIVKIIEDMHSETIIYCAKTMEEAYAILARQRIHLFLLDIILDSRDSGDVSGLRFAEEIRKNSKYKYTPVIFITALEDPKLYTYSQLHCYDYIEKPFSIPRVEETIKKALEIPIKSDEDKFLYFRKDGIIYSKKINDIIYIESSRRKICMHCMDDVLEIPYKTTEQILRELDSENFIQCSRYSILNKKYIEQIDYENRFVKMKYVEKTVEIGRVKLKNFRAEMEHG